MLHVSCLQSHASRCSIHFTLTYLDQRSREKIMNHYFHPNYKIFNLRLLLTPSFVIISAISLISTLNISPNFPSPKKFCDTVATVKEFVSHWRKQYNSLTFFLKSLWASMTVNMISLARNGGGRGVTSSGS